MNEMKPDKISVTYNLEDSSDQPSESISREYVEKVLEAISSLGFEVTPVEVTGSPDEIVDRILESKPELIFNLAEGAESQGREAYYPTIFEILNIPYTGGGPAIMYVNLDKRLTLKLLDVNGIRVPKGKLIRSKEDSLPEDMEFPAFIKPNYEGSSMGIGEKSVVNSREEATERIEEMIDRFPAGIDVEEFIAGRELTVPMLEEFPGRLLEIVEYSRKGQQYNIMDYQIKKTDKGEDELETLCPPELDPMVRQSVLELASRTFRMMRTPDLGRVDIRLSEEGEVYLIEVTALPGLRPVSPMITSADQKGLSYNDVIDLILKSAIKRCFSNRQQ